MKANLSRMLRSGVCLLLALCMVVGMCPVVAFATETSEETKEINYVSIGDSMANGYGFVDYAQNSDDRNLYDFMTGKGMYGKGAYPLQFEEYLTEQGYDVNHTKLATSAMLPEDLLFLLGGRAEINDGWGGWRDYVGTYSDEEIIPHVQKAVKEADLVTMGIGNAAFGAYMLNMVTSALGVFGASLDADEKMSVENAIAHLTGEQEKQTWRTIEAIVDEAAKAYITEEIAAQYNVEDAMNIVKYTAVSFIVNYTDLVEKMLEMNPDVNVILVGLLNTTYGMNITDENGNVVLAFGDMMDSVFKVLNAYMAALPTTLGAEGEFYFAEQPEPKFICQVFQKLKNSGWEDIDQDKNGVARLSGTTVRDRNIDAFNGSLAEMIGSAVTDAPLAKITIEDVQAYEAIDWAALMEKTEELEAWAQTYVNSEIVISNPWIGLTLAKYVPLELDLTNPANYEKAGEVLTAISTADATGEMDKDIDMVLSCAIYLAIEEAVANSTTTMDIQLSGLLKIAGDLSSVFTNLGTPPTGGPELTRVWLLEGLSTEETQGMCKIYGLFKVGNGMSVHPTPSGHDEIVANVIKAYEEGHTADVETDKNLEGYDDVAAIKDIYDYLRSNELIETEQTYSIINFVLACLEDAALSDEELFATAQFTYETLLYKESLNDAKRLDIVVNVCKILAANGYLKDYEKELKVLEEIVALPELEYLTAKQTFGIVDMIYRAIKDGEVDDADTRGIIAYIYLTVFKSGEIMPISEGEQEKILTAAEKLAVIEAVYKVLEKNGYLNAAETPALKAAEEIYVGLRGLEGKEQLLSDEKIFEIIDRVFVELFKAKEITEATVEALVKEIVEDVLFDTEISAASKIEIVKVVYNALKNNGLITDELVYNEAYKAMASLYEYLRNYMIENGADKVLGDAYQFALDNGYIDMLNAALADLKDRVLAELDAYVNGAAPELKTALADLEAQAKALETELAGLKAELEAKVAELEAQMNAAAGQTAADIQAAIEATKAAIAEIEQTIAETEAALAEVYAGIEACKATLVDLESAIRYLDNAVVALDGKIAELYAILTNGSNESVEAVMAAVEAAKDTIESTINLVQTAYNSAEDLAETVAALSVKAAKAVQNAAENSLSILEGLSEGMADYTEGFAEEEKAKLIAEIQAEYGDQIALLENNKELILAAGALAAQVIYDRESQPDGAIPALEKEIETKKAELETAAEEAKAQIEAKITELEAQLTEKKAQVEQEAQDAYDKAVVEAEKQYNTTVAEIEAMIPVLEAELEAKIAEVKAQAEAAYGEIKPIVDAALPVIENVLANSDTIMASIEAAIPAAMQAVEDGINYVIDTWNKAYANATTQAYLLNSDSYYVALGDSSAVAGKNYNSYVDELAAELELSKDEYVNYATELNTALDQLKDLQTNTALQADLAKADLVTVGFSNVTFMSNTVNTLVDQYFSGEAVKPDWTPFVTEEGVKYIDAIRDEIFEGLTTYLDEPMDEETAALVTAAIESYAYGVVAYACTVPELVNAIHGINDDAVIIIVGMYNPMDGVVIDMNGTSLDIGEYVNYLVDAAEIHGTAYSMITGNSIYVNAPDVETLNTKSSLGIMDLVNLYATNCQVLNPSANGHEYIQTCIYNALGLARPSAVRVYGSNRYVTSMNIAKTMKGIANGAAFENVVVANGGDFPDALAGTYLADVKNAPILLVSDGYAAEVAAYIKANMTEGGTIYILGGENSVSKATEETLKSVTANVKRVAGKNRYVTNLEILEEAGASGKELLVVDGNQAWDSLSASSSGCPVLLVNKTLREDQKEYLAGTSFEEITIIGGTNSIPESMAAELSAYCDDIDRVSGSNRYKTSVAVAEYFYGTNNKNVVLAWGGNFPDGLCGGALASALNAPVVLTDNAEAEVDAYVKQAYLGVVTGGEGKDGSQITDEEVVEIFELFSTEDIVENPYN